MDRERWTRGLSHLLFIALAGIALGTLTAVAGFSDYGPIVVLDVGSTIIGLSLAVGIALGLQARDDEPQAVVLRGFLASVIAIGIVVMTIFAPVVAGVVESLEDLGSSGPARIAFIFASLFIVPMVLVGTMIGYALSDFLAPTSSWTREDGGD